MRYVSFLSFILWKKELRFKIKLIVVDVSLRKPTTMRNWVQQAKTERQKQSKPEDVPGERNQWAIECVSLCVCLGVWEHEKQMERKRSKNHIEK